jgi:hypothetical protein
VGEREARFGRRVERDQDVAIAEHGCIVSPATLAVPWTM